MKHLFALLFLFNCLGTPCFALQHDRETDSLKKLLHQTSARTNVSDTLTVDRLNELALSYYESAPDSTVYYANMAISLATKTGSKKGIAEGFRQLGMVTSLQGNYNLANKHYQNSLKLYASLNDKMGISDAYVGMGRVQDFLGNYDSAISYFDKALVIRKKLNNQIKIADSYAILGITYDNKGDLTRALENYFKSLSIDLKLNDQISAADNYCNIGVVMQHLELYPKALEYFDKANSLWLRLDDKQGISTAYQNIGEVFLSQKKYQQAYSYFTKAFTLYKELGDEEGIGLIYYNIGLYHYYTGNPDSAIHYLNQSVLSSQKSKIVYNLTNAYNGLALVYNLEKNFTLARQYAVLALHLSKKITSLNLQADAMQQLSTALAGLNKYQEAYYRHNQYVSLKDSLKNEESLQKFTSYSQTIQFEENQRKTAQKEKQLIDKLAQQRRTNLIYGLVIVVITTMLVFYYNAKRKQLEANALLADKNKEVNEQAEKLNDLNHLKDRLISILAHDLRAPLSTLRGAFALLISKDISDEEFVEMVPLVFNKLKHTSDFLDTLLFWINSQVDDVADTVKSFCLCDVIKDELLLLDDQFKQKNITCINTVGKGHRVFADPKSIRIVVHNLLTNAIKFSHCNSAIEISAEHLDDHIQLIIKDHGIGMDNERLKKLFAGKVNSQVGTMNEVGTGMGLIFCKDLVEKYQGTITAKSTAGKGTEFSFVLPADK